VVKDVQIYLYGLKKTSLGVLDIEEIRDNDNETGLKEEGGIEMSIYSAFYIRDARSLSLLNNLPDTVTTSAVTDADANKEGIIICKYCENSRPKHRPILA
jgi:hypothetical protein